jgi:hypothetical protein
MKYSRIFFTLVSICLLALSAFNAKALIWEPGQRYSPMITNVHNRDGDHRKIIWRDRGGFRITVDHGQPYDNWHSSDEAPRVKLDLSDELDHLRNEDFVIQTRIILPEKHGALGNGPNFHAGIYIGFGSNNLVVFGPHGSYRLRLRGPFEDGFWVDYNSRICFLKIKRNQNVYTAWHSEDGEIWVRDGTFQTNRPLTDIGAIVKTWGGSGSSARASFDFFDVTHVEGVENTYFQNDPRYFSVINPIEFVYNLLGVKIPVLLYIRNSPSDSVNLYDRKMYFIHGTIRSEHEYLNGREDKMALWHRDIIRNAGQPINQTDFFLIAPIFKQWEPWEHHPLFEDSWQYRSFKGEEDWILIDLHENFIRERFPATTLSIDDSFYLTGSSAGGQFSNRFILTHPNKLHSAITRAPGGVTFPYQQNYYYADSVWPLTTRIHRDIRDKNPRIKIDMKALGNLKFTALCGDNDNYLFLPIAQPGVANHVDGCRKWINQIRRETNNGQLFIVPQEAHGYGTISRMFTIAYFFHSGLPSNTTPTPGWRYADWEYSNSLPHNDGSIDVYSSQVPDEVFHLTRFQKWRRTDQTIIEGYDLNPSGSCIIRNENGRPVGSTTWAIIRSSDNGLGLQIDSESYHHPKLHYGRLFFVSTDNRYLLEQTAFVTQTFINNWVVNREFYIYSGDTRDLNGPIATISDDGPFKLILSGNNRGRVTSTRLDQPIEYRNPLMQRWRFDPINSILHFLGRGGASENEEGRQYPKIGEWRWGYYTGGNGNRFVAGIDTRNDHNRIGFNGDGHIEIQSDDNNNFYNRYFEEWDMGINPNSGANRWQP